MRVMGSHSSCSLSLTLKLPKRSTTAKRRGNCSCTSLITGFCSKVVCTTRTAALEASRKNQSFTAISFSANFPSLKEFRISGKRRTTAETSAASTSRQITASAGYCDWNFSEFNPKISVHENHLEDFETCTVGTYGLCICCGDEISEGLYCEYCDNDESEICDECEERCESTTTVINEYGEHIEVCDSCLEDGYRFCPHCDEYYPRDTMTVVGNNYVCENCLAEYYEQCYECGDYQHRDELHSVINQSGEEVTVCEDCRYNYYEHCDCCQNICHEDIMTDVHVRDTDNQIRVCDDCRENYYQECETCGEFFHNDYVSDGICPNCRQDEEDDTND